MKIVTLEEYKNLSYIKSSLDSLPDKPSDEDIKNLYLMEGKCGEIFRTHGFAFQDLSRFDLSLLTPEVARVLVFSSSTIFPSKDKMPSWFKPQKILKNALQRKIGKITLPKNDKKLAIIDNPTQFYCSNAFKKANIEFVDLASKDDTPHFHMEGVLGNVCADKVGAVQNLDIVAYASRFADRTDCVLEALKDVYSRIEKGEKICAVNISSPLIWDWQKPKKKVIKEVFEYVEKLKNNKKCRCEVIDSYRFVEESGFMPVYCKNGDVNNIDDYFIRPHKTEGDFVCFMTSKVIPEFASHDGWWTSCDGVSWAIPIASALYSGCRIYDDNLTFEEFVKICRETFVVNKNQTKIVDIQAVLDKVKAKR